MMAEDGVEITFEVFGDESVVGQIVAYAAVIVPAMDVAALSDEVARIKTAYGQREAADLHCRVLFNGDSRARSDWRDLALEDVFSLYGGVATLLARSRATLLCIFANKSRLPKTDPGGPWRTRSGLIVPGPTVALEFGEKQWASLCANATQIPLKVFPGLNKVRFWADPDRTRIEWAGRRRQVANTLTMWIAGEGRPAQRVSAERIGSEKPSLLQLADFVAYSFARATARRPSQTTLRFKQFVHRLAPFVGQVKLGPHGLNVSMPSDRMASHLRSLVEGGCGHAHQV